jgi:hypothetical protein
MKLVSNIMPLEIAPHFGCLMYANNMNVVALQTYGVGVTLALVDVVL